MTPGWTNHRIARLSFLMGAGWDAKSIAADLIIACHSATVYRQAHKYGLSFPSRRLRKSPEFSEVFTKAADKRSLSRDALIRLLLTEIAKEPYLLDNILDDGA